MTGRKIGCAIVLLGMSDSTASHGSWPFSTNNNLFVSPAVADINSDGGLEIVFGGWDGNLYCVTADGSELWVAPLHDGVGSPPQLHSLFSQPTSRPSPRATRHCF